VNRFRDSGVSGKTIGTSYPVNKHREDRPKAAFSTTKHLPTRQIAKLPKVKSFTLLTERAVQAKASRRKAILRPILRDEWAFMRTIATDSRSFKRGGLLGLAASAGLEEL